VYVCYCIATIQYYITFTVPALPSQNVEHVSTLTIMITILTVQYVSDDGALRLLQDSDQALPITCNLSKWRFFSCLRGQAATPQRSTRDIRPRNLIWRTRRCVWWWWVLLVRVSLFHLRRRLVGTGAPCRGTRTSKPERVEQKERNHMVRSRAAGVHDKAQGFAYGYNHSEY
jgi:hypothetical protein